MIFEIELYFPTAKPGAAAETESLGPCKPISQNLFLTITEHNGEARLVPFNDVVEVDVANHRYVSAHGRTFYPRRIDLPDHFMVETAAGYARTVKGVQVARLVRSKRDSPGKGVSW